MCLSDAHERHANGCHGGPRRTDEEAHDGAEQAAADEEPLGAQYLNTVVDHGGYDARDHPRATDGSDEQEDDDGGGATGNLVGDFLFESPPLQPPSELPYEHGDGRCHEQRHLTGTIKRCVAKDGNATRNESY